MLSVFGTDVFIIKSTLLLLLFLTPDSGTAASILGQITKLSTIFFYLGVSIFLTSDLSQEASQSFDFHGLSAL